MAAGFAVGGAPGKAAWCGGLKPAVIGEPGAPGSGAGVSGPAGDFWTSNIRLVSTPPLRISTMLFSTSMETTSMLPSRSPSRRIGFLTVPALPASCSVISKIARLEDGPKMLVIPVKTTLASGAGGGTGAGGGDGSGGGFKAKTLRATIDSEGLALACVLAQGVAVAPKRAATEHTPAFPLKFMGLR